tara:strand:- start:119 stop:853 length:735 start_codon:yes stop_codon:yes gene_type:complete
MTLKIRKIYTPNFDLMPRKRNLIKFLILHYTGMKSEKLAIQRLSKIQSGVGTNYFVKKNGEILIMIPDLYTAWHAGISQWGRIKFLNKCSIGIEISNPGHQFGYVNFTKKQIKSLIILLKKLVKKYNIKKKHILGHSDIAPDRKRDPGEKFPWKILHKNNIGVWHKINTHKLISLRKKTVSIKETSLFMKKLSKFGYPLKSDIIKNNKKYSKLLIKAFQRRFRPELISGKLDQECLLILNNLVK